MARDEIDAKGIIAWPQLIRGTLIRRYKRFLADVLLEGGQTVTAHCPNSGSMKACCEPGRPVFLSRHDNPKRKLAYTWELIEMPPSLVGVNTGIPNRLVYQADQEFELISPGPTVVLIQDKAVSDPVTGDPVTGVAPGGRHPTASRHSARRSSSRIR